MIDLIRRLLSGEDIDIQAEIELTYYDIAFIIIFIVLLIYLIFF